MDSNKLRSLEHLIRRPRQHIRPLIRVLLGAQRLQPFNCRKVLSLDREESSRPAVLCALRMQECELTRITWSLFLKACR
jgi:hypothetical protein